jgi:ParB-like chromosome segregation protein Spo0J
MTDSLILLELIDDNPFQTRQAYEDAGIAELAADIYARGLLQPPVGRQVDGRMQLEPERAGEAFPVL